MNVDSNTTIRFSNGRPVRRGSLGLSLSGPRYVESICYDESGWTLRGTNNDIIDEGGWNNHPHDGNDWTGSEFWEPDGKLALNPKGFRFNGRDVKAEDGETFWWTFYELSEMLDWLRMRLREGGDNEVAITRSDLNELEIIVGRLGYIKATDEVEEQ